MSASRTIPAFVVAGVKSGCGKTTASLAIMAALARRGLSVQAFKTGPDFIDPGHHALAAGRPSHNLDGWMMGTAAVEAAFARYAADADAVVVEGAMGLYDGLSGADDRGSAAEIARLLDLPVVLVLDAASMGRSAAAMALGYASFDPRLRLAGVIADNVAGPRHEDILREAFAGLANVPFLGALPRDGELALPSRHLGLVTAEDARLGPDYFAKLARLAEDRLDLGGLLARAARPVASPPHVESPSAAGPPVRLAVSRDRAFCFLYPENLRLMEAAGAEIVFFSPLADADLPPQTSGVYLCGGYPELHARALAANGSMRAAIKAFADAGGPVYAECGGFMYLMRAIRDEDGRGAPMAGVFPFTAVMDAGRRALGYREVTTTAASLLGPAGTHVRGHEFHYSRIAEPGPPQAAGVAAVYTMTGSRGVVSGPEGFVSGSVLGSYVHLHLASNEEIPRNFLRLCREFAAARGPEARPRG